MKPSTILVTGASGFLGRAVVAEAVRRGFQVRATARRHGDIAGADWITHDLTQQNSVDPLVNGVDAVVHIAGLAHKFARISRDALFHMNVDATARLATAAARHGVGHFILISSASVYGPHAGMTNEKTVCTPDTAYGESKLAGEQAALSELGKGTTRLTVLRPVTLFGAGDPGNVFRLMQAIDQRRFVWIGEGSNQKTLLHVSDAASAVVRALDGGTSSASIFNVAGITVPMREIVDQLAGHLGRRVPSFHVPARLALSGAGAVAKIFPAQKIRRIHSTISKWLNDDVYDGTLFATTFGIQSCVSLSEGLRDEVAWYRRMP